MLKTFFDSATKEAEVKNQLEVVIIPGYKYFKFLDVL